mgnify:CR=1 FL=1
MEEMQLIDPNEERIDVVDNFIDPAQLLELRNDLNHFNWNPFETDIYQGNRVLSGMIADLPKKWTTLLDEKIIKQAREFVDKDYHIHRAYLNAWKCDDVSLPHHDGGHTTVVIYCNRDYHIKYGGETIFYDKDEDVIGAVSPKPGRAVFFNGWLLHKAGSFNRLYQHDYRYTLAYKLTTKEDEEFAKTEGANLYDSYGENNEN